MILTRNYSYFLLFFLLTGISCQKKDVISPATPATPPAYKTVYPGNYFPVYPGSSWKYVTNKTDTSVIRSSPDYVKHSYLVYNGVAGTSYPSVYSDTVYVPFWNGVPIYGYNKVVLMTPLSTYDLRPILSETVGFYFEKDHIDPRHYYPRYSTMLEVTEKTVDVKGDSILVIRGIIPFYTGNANPPYFEQVYVYTKFVGLSGEYIINTDTHDTIRRVELVDYSINHTF